MNEDLKTNATPLVAVTGSSGYVGGAIANGFRKAGWELLEFTRSSKLGDRVLPFRLGENVAPKAFQGVDALVHCAYDFTCSRWSDIHAINVCGAERLFRAAAEAGVSRLVCISSISAFDGCKSLYGKAKLEIEKVARSFGALVIRPGLVHGSEPGAMFGSLIRQVRKSRVQPLVGGGGQVQYLVHAEDLADLIIRYCSGKLPLVREGKLIAAHLRPWTLRELLQEIAHAQSIALRFIPIPWQPVWLALKVAESCGLRVPFRSDSLISLVNQNPAPEFPDFEQLAWHPREFHYAAAPSTQSTGGEC